MQEVLASYYPDPKVHNTPSMSASRALLLSVAAMLLHLVTCTTTTTTTTTISTAATLHYTITKAKTKASSYPDFQLLSVKQAITETKIKPLKPSQYQELYMNNPNDGGSEGRQKLKLFHRDKVSFNSKLHNHSHVFHARMQRDVKRVASLIRRVSSGSAASHEVEDFGSEVVSGTNQGSGEYFVRIGVGSPPRSQYMVIDSGSDIVWVQCKPCTQCYNQTDPLFDPADSASFMGVSCSSAVCDQVENAGCNSGRCRYEVSYGDGSSTKGTIALETLTLGRTVVENVAIGCGHMNQGMFVGAAGLLGLGGGSMSFVGQLSRERGNAFSYCLVSRATNSNGFLEFGSEAMPVGAAWIPLIRNPHSPSYYYVGLSGLGVGGVRVPISEDMFRLTELGNGGVVMDTGTAVTRFPTVAYEAFRDAFIDQTGNLPRASAISIFDTCYNLFGFLSVRVPTVSFYFSGGPILTLPANNFLIPVDDAGTFCFAFAPSPSELSILGNIQQEGIQISVDGANEFVGFGPNVC